MANLHGAIGLAQLAKMPKITATRQAACKRYSESLSGIRELQTPISTFDDVTPFLYYIRVPAGRRQPLRDHLKAVGIDTGIHWQPGHWFSLLKDCKRGDLSVTEHVGHQILSLPLHSDMDCEVQERVIKAVHAYFHD